MTPIKPFDTYKWRWLSTTPSEGLLDPPVFLGVLRALSRHEGQPPSDTGLINDLQIVDNETKSSVDLVRTPERNLIRNSGQYWKGTGLLMPSDGLIQLTGLGRKIASGAMSQGEFAAIMIQQTILPNPWTMPIKEAKKWQDAKLEIRPFKLILELLNVLGKHYYPSSAHISNDELVKVVIPLAGTKSKITEIAENIILYRAGSLNVTNWPNCAPGANDRRMAREFLLFLANFGILRPDVHGSRDEQKYFLDELFNVQEIGKLTHDTIFSKNQATVNRAIQTIEHSELPSIVERLRVRAEVFVRKGQPLFRAKTLEAFHSRCLLTNECVPMVLEAAHIVPVKHGGSDELDNSLCLRVDVHRLFDSGQLRLKADGTIAMSSLIANSVNYQQIPKVIQFPAFIKPANVRWRDDYL